MPPKHIHFVCRTFVSSVDQEFSTVNLWVGAGVRCYWIAKSESCHWQMLGLRLRYCGTLGFVHWCSTRHKERLGLLVSHVHPSPHFLLVYRMLLYSDSATAVDDDEECVVSDRREHGKLLKWVCPPPCWVLTSFKLRYRPARIDSVHSSCRVLSTANRNYSAPAS